MVLITMGVIFLGMARYIDMYTDNLLSWLVLRVTILYTASGIGGYPVPNSCNFSLVCPEFIASGIQKSKKSEPV